MSRLFAYVGNDADRVECALYAARASLVVPVEGQTPAIDSWGIGLYQGEILLQRRPKAPTAPLDLYAAVRELRTDIIVGHVRAGTVGKPKNENTHPFRFRSWLFAHHGTLPGGAATRDALLGKMPDFLARNMRGQTDSEALFLLVLGELHRLQKLDDPMVAGAVLRQALGAALRTVSTVAGADAVATMEGAIVLTNGRTLLASRHGAAPVWVREGGPVLDCPVCREKAPLTGRRDRRVDHEHLRSVLVVAAVSEPPPGARELPNGQALTVTHEIKPEIGPL